jgi:hypothetical protein
MIVERLVFSLKFGKAKDAKALMKEFKNLMPAEMLKNSRVLFDLVGPSYTLVMETTHESLTEMEKMFTQEMPNAKEWESWYQRFIPLVEKSYREIFTIYEG